MDAGSINASGHAELIAAIGEEIEQAGAITFARFMEVALYQPSHGYYLSESRRPGRGGDFLTAPEASALFGITLARQVAECWERMGRPRPFTIREYGAGAGVLAYDIIAGLSEDAPDLIPDLRYRLVEPNPHRLAEALGAMAEAGLGEIVAGEPAIANIDLDPITGIVIANEVADALPVHRLTVIDGRWRECYVTWDDGGLREMSGALSDPVRAFPAYFDRHGVAMVEGTRYDVSPAAAGWFAAAVRGLERGYALVIDYGYPVRSLYQEHRLTGTVRGYRGHTVTGDPFAHIGEQDLTAHVDFTALEEAGKAAGLTPAGFTTQGALLASLGLGDRLLAIQSDPETTLAGYRSAQAVVLRLIDPGGLGRFGVLIMARDAPVDPPLLGLTVSPPPF